MLYYVRLFVWSAFWLVAWPLTLPFRKPKQHNCLTWALREIEKNDGYLVIRWCRSSIFPWLKWPHFLYLDTSHHDALQHFVPDDGDSAKRVVPEPWFAGHIKTGDSPDERDDN